MPFLTGIQEGTQCTKCKNNWALKLSIILLYILCALLTITVAILGYKGKYCFLFPSKKQVSCRSFTPENTSTFAGVK